MISALLQPHRGRFSYERAKKIIKYYYYVLNLNITAGPNLKN